MESKPTCSCSCGDGALPMIFACSGAADVGELTDRAARRLSREKKARMYCASAIAAEIEEYLTKTREADYLLVIDGCEHHCAKNILQNANFNSFLHICLSDHGFVKGQSPANGQNIGKVANICVERM